MLTYDKIANPMSHQTAVNDSCRYSGPEPQSLPLPPELFVRALSYLDQACDKKNARLVCKGFAAAGLYSLTSTVYFSTSLIQIGCLSEVPLFSCPTRDIAMHPVVSKYITKLICDGTLLPVPYLTFETFQEWWATLGKNQMPWSVPYIHSIYTFRYRQETLIIGTNEDREIFRTALEQFVSLKCIVFTDVAADEQTRGLPRLAWPWTAPGGDLYVQFLSNFLPSNTLVRVAFFCMRGCQFQPPNSSIILSICVQEIMLIPKYAVGAHPRHIIASLCVFEHSQKWPSNFMNSSSRVAILCPIACSRSSHHEIAIISSTSLRISAR